MNPKLILAAALLIVAAGMVSGETGDVAFQKTIDGVTCTGYELPNGEPSVLAFEAIPNIGEDDILYIDDMPIPIHEPPAIIYDDITVTDDCKVPYGNFTAEDFNVSVNWSEVEIARTDDVYIKGHKVPEWGEDAAAWILNLIF
jgi:hypothetical protein